VISSGCIGGGYILQKESQITHPAPTTTTTSQVVTQKQGECFNGSIRGIKNQFNSYFLPQERYRGNYTDVTVCNNYEGVMELFEEEGFMIEELPSCVDFGIAHTNGNFVLGYFAYDSSLPTDFNLFNLSSWYYLYDIENLKLYLLDENDLIKYNIKITEYELLIKNPKPCYLNEAIKESNERMKLEEQRRLKESTSIAMSVMSSKISADIVAIN
jgi:hypothetical protein